MSLQTLHSLCAHSDILSNEFETRLCDKFLEVRVFCSFYVYGMIPSNYRKGGNLSSIVILIIDYVS